MESRRFKIGKKEADEIISEKGRCQDVSQEYVKSIFDKLRRHQIKIETILFKCEALDSNGDGIVHADDIIDVINDLLPRKTISRREYHYFIEALTRGQGSNHNIRFMQMERLYEDSKRHDRQQDGKERWHEDALEPEFTGPRGSIGDFLNKSACPSEVQNYKTLMACLEKFERETGLCISTNEEGFRIPLGPDLKASISFNINAK
jgi:hypothetical protein